MTRRRSEVKQEQIDWRRQKVLELASDGYTIREIGADSPDTIPNYRQGHATVKKASEGANSQIHHRTGTFRI